MTRSPPLSTNRQIEFFFLPFGPCKRPPDVPAFLFSFRGTRKTKITIVGTRLEVIHPEVLVQIQLVRSRSKSLKLYPYGFNLFRFNRKQIFLYEPPL